MQNNKVATLSRPTFSLANKNGEYIQGKSYEPKLFRVRQNWTSYIYLQSTGSMETSEDTKVACSLAVLFEPLQLDGNWRVTIAEITFPPSIKNVTNKDYFTLLERQKNF